MLRSFDVQIFLGISKTNAFKTTPFGRGAHWFCDIQILFFFCPDFMLFL